MLARTGVFRQTLRRSFRLTSLISARALHSTGSRLNPSSSSSGSSSVSSSNSHPFSFLPANALEPKATRTKGLTEIRGPYYAPVTQTYLDELLKDWGEYVDGVKFAGGAFSLMPEDRLRTLIDTAHKHGCYVSTGGFIERVLSTSGGNKSVVSKYLTTCKNLGYAVT
ncbi:hypothetical protein NUW54_g8463 [Trametes sanguinea]|uniref:Uncharacterized protein n=1 Tax=Trametes sanguinea TaxID=158606 RepID=A0ACC1PD77_9APHY|nr:hypothetical protein NUW54_g8463 [Trametes sanguinea]